MNRINGWRKFKSDREFRGRCIVSILLLFAIVVIALPIIVASSMSFYCGDDFAQLPIKEFNGNIIELLWMALRYAKKMYLNWQGAYFSMFINIMLHPILGAGLTQLRVVMVINALMLVIAISVFVWELCKDEINLYYNKLLLIVCCVGGILGFECWQEIFYWYTGIAGYTIPFSLLLFALAIVIASRKRIYYFIAGVLIFCASGGEPGNCRNRLLLDAHDYNSEGIKEKAGNKRYCSFWRWSVWGIGKCTCTGKLCTPCCNR